METRKLSVRTMVSVAMLSAVAYVLMLIDFSVPLMPSFIKMDLSDLPALIGAYALGPVAG
ncbi:MAG: ECF transporter S component, partial [Ruminococcaceae bacterium]|nr:ECF transporter S component [Oscillospiraceae bacterium]